MDLGVGLVCEEGGDRGGFDGTHGVAIAGGGRLGLDIDNWVWARVELDWICEHSVTLLIGSTGQE